MNAIEIDGIVYGVGQVRQIIESAVRYEATIARVRALCDKHDRPSMTWAGTPLIPATVSVDVLRAALDGDGHTYDKVCPVCGRDHRLED